MRDISGNTIGISVTPPTMINGVPSLVGFPDNGTKLGELDLMLWQYCEGLTSNIQTAKQNGGLLNDNVLIGALNSITGPVPGLSQAISLAGKLSGLINDAFGVGSVPGRIAQAIFSGNLITNPIGTIETLFSGRTYRYDQYQLAVAYSFHVLGKDIGSTEHAADSLVIEACKYFEDRLGIFINGLNSLRALVVDQSAINYMKMVNECPFITIDVARVNAALTVTRQYMPDGGSLGNWAGTIGVYDRELVALANSGYKDYYSNLSALKQSAVSGNTGILNNVVSSNSNFIIYLVIAIVIIILLVLIFKK